MAWTNSSTSCAWSRTSYTSSSRWSSIRSFPTRSSAWASSCGWQRRPGATASSASTLATSRPKSSSSSPPLLPCRTAGTGAVTIWTARTRRGTGSRCTIRATAGAGIRTRTRSSRFNKCRRCSSCSRACRGGPHSSSRSPGHRRATSTAVARGAKKVLAAWTSRRASARLCITSPRTPWGSSSTCRSSTRSCGRGRATAAGERMAPSALLACSRKGCMGGTIANHP
mmetsp:Transcript_102791/g.290439  ORF Transcript_102791/g.290439 Transcript_102791/m.290439 type:complete len:226 (+) Transcript_102791:531-1208(+)